MTVWDTFFMILTVIPASKFLRDIFMKLIARVGGVNEEALAGKGMALLGIGAALIGNGKKMLPGLGGGIPLMPGGDGSNGGSNGMVQGFNGFSGALGGNSGLNTNTPSPMLNLPSISQGVVGGGYAPGGYGTANASAVGGVAPTPAGGLGYGNSSLNSPIPAGYSQRSSGLIVPSSLSDDGGESSMPAAPTNQTSPSPMQEMLSGRGLQNSGNIGKAIGVAAAAGAPGVAPVTAGIMSAAARPIYAVTKMAGSLSAETYRQFKDGKGMSSMAESVKSYTGNQSALKGAVSMAGAATASVFGSKAANYVAGAFSPSVNDRINW